MEEVRTDRENVIRFSIEHMAVTITFSEEESAGVKAVIRDILTEAYGERLERERAFAKAS